MSYNKSEQSLHIEPRRSFSLALLLLLIHGSAMVIIAQVDLPWWLKFGLVGSVIVLLVANWHLYVMARGKKAIRMLVWDAGGSWTLVTDRQQSLQAKLLPFRLIFPQLIVLLFRVEGKNKYSSIIMQDALDPRLYRRLLMRLRLDRPS